MLLSPDPYISGSGAKFVKIVFWQAYDLTFRTYLVHNNIAFFYMSFVF